MTESNTSRSAKQTASRPPRRPSATGTSRTTGTRTSSRPKRTGSSRPGPSIRERNERTKRTQTRRVHDRPTPKDQKSTMSIPALESGVRIIPLGGVEEVGRNMTVIETPDDIFVCDVGFQFIGDDEAPGIDYVLPNTAYLEERKDKITAVLITHGHLDHIGGLPFLMNRLGNPPVYTLPLTAIMIAKRHEEFPHLPKIDVRTLEVGSKLKIGNTVVSAFSVTHSIPDSVGFDIETTSGHVLISGDLKLAHEDGEPSKKERDTFGKLGEQDNLLLIADSTNAERSGFSIPESKVINNIEQIITDVKGRLIIGTFASQFERMIMIIKTAENLGKKIVTEGRSIKTNIEIAQKAGLLTVKKGTIITPQEIDQHPAEKIVVIATGAQGEEHAALMRIATKRHKQIKFTERDTVVLSSSVIPGNEIAVQKLKDNLYRGNVRLLHYRASDVHSTGHGNSGELVWINKQVKPTFFMPAYGFYSMTFSHAQAVVESGFKKENIILADNGTIVDFPDKDTMIRHKEKAPSEAIHVDGFNIGNVQEVVLRDRQALAQDGMFVMIIMINVKTGKLKKSPDIISRGFVYLRESQELLGQARLLTKKTIETAVENMHPIDFDFLKKELAETVGSFLLQKTNKAPVVIPVILGV